MDLPEFSNQFDVLYNNITSNQAPGLSEYEKSIFLTKGQDEIVKNYFNAKGNKYQEGFDDSAKRQIDFSMLMDTVTPDLVTAINPLHHGNNNKCYKLPDNILLYINEFLDVTRNGKSMRLVVVPVSYDEYNRVMSKPYKRPIKNQAWRLINNSSALYTYTDYEGLASVLTEHENSNTLGFKLNKEEILALIYGKRVEFNEDESYIKVDNEYLGSEGLVSDDGDTGLSIFPPPMVNEIKNNIAKKGIYLYPVSELIAGANDTIKKYTVRFIRKPRPIILENLEDLTIEGISEASECELDSSIHQEILQRAVELAKIAWSNTGQDNTEAFLQAGQRSE